MKIKNLVKYICFIALTYGLSSCSKDDNLDKDIVGLGGEKWEKNEIDKYIYTTFVKPYNIDVLYRWNASEVSYVNNLVPPKEEKVIPVMDMVLKGWIEPYTKVAGTDFIKKFAPRQYLLVGSPEYNSSGTITLGTAEAGAKIVLFRVNWFDLKDRELIQAMLKTIHHEFAHILHQTIMYPKDFEAISAADYTSTWNQINVTDALNAGFISSYSMSGPDDDFVELASIMLVQGYGPFEEIIKSISNPVGVRKIREKQKMVLNYFLQTWNIDLYDLQRETEAAINKMSPPPTAFEQIGFGRPSTVLFTSSTTDVPSWSKGFKDIFDQASSSLGTMGNVGRYLEDVNLIYYKEATVMMRLKYKNPTNPTANFNADFKFDVVEDPITKKVLFRYVGTSTDLNATMGGNGNSILPYVKELINYYDGHTFQFNWSNDGVYPTSYAKMLRDDNSANYMYALLKNTY